MKKAIIKVAGPHSTEEIESIKAQFAELLDKTYVFEIVEDSSLIGGFAAYIDGKVYDASIALQIENLRRSFGEKITAGAAEE